ncbi:MAG: ribose-phosphate pyrophosphokinase-like domain-containing protein, partial [Nevskiales bacterium]
MTDTTSQLMLFTGNANRELAQDIANYLRVPVGKAVVGRFSDGEVQIEILENVRGKDVFIIQPTCMPTNESVMDLLMMLDALVVTDTIPLNAEAAACPKIRQLSIAGLLAETIRRVSA